MYGLINRSQGLASKVLVACALGRCGRRAQVYGVGTAKSGTHSLAEMFAKGARAGHEPQSSPLIEKILAAAAGQISREKLAHWVRARDRELALEVDASQLNYFVLDLLLAEFPDARFLLTIRDPYSWLDSFINHVLRYTPAGADWSRLRDFRFKTGIFAHAREERVLEEKGLHTLDGYLSYWAMHNQNVLNRVPAQRLFVVKTTELRQRAHEIADFAGLPRSSVDLNRTHGFQNSKKFNVLREIDPAFLADKVEKHCGKLMRQFFPEIASLEDAKI